MRPFLTYFVLACVCVALFPMTISVSFAADTNTPPNAITVDENGNVGVGKSGAQTELDIQDNDGRVAIRLGVNEDSGESWQIIVDEDGNANQGLSFTKAGTGRREFRMDPNGNLRITGALITSGATCSVIPCDGVFRPDEFQAPPIEEHAAFMWENQHLRAVGPTKEGQPINLTKKTTGILHELEIAHIYIEQLDTKIQQMQSVNKQLQQHLATLQSQQQQLYELVQKLPLTTKIPVTINSD